jgi:hypothetical protein
MLLPAPVFVSAPGLTATAGRQATRIGDLGFEGLADL